ncbi:MAG: recombination mediator RecR [Erysipelotrichaceae bacterium]|nr:recombination mediator RecR [Erysipelotrichaceae bacterium]
MYPKDFEKLIEDLAKLPGVGNKTAMRYAFKIMDWTKEDVALFIENIKKVKNEIHYCRRCGFLTNDDECDYCKDKTRNQETIVVVSYVQDVEAIERIGEYNGLYHVLNGNLSTSKGIMPDDLNIESLLDRINENTKEVILAISPTIDGEMTALYLSKLLKKKEVKITKLASGLPMGANLDYADDLTILKAMNNRQKMED